MDIIKEIHVTGEIPSARTEHTANLVGRSTVIVFGGIDGQNEKLNDTYSLDMESLVWQRVPLDSESLSKDQDLVPHKRQSHAACEGGDSLL